MRIIEPSIKIVTSTPSALQVIERIGRICYKSEDKITVDSAEKFVRRIVKSGHHSVIEHANLSVIFICNRGVTHELVRHRLAAYSQESTRYCDYSSEKFGREIAVVVPYGLEQGTVQYGAWREGVNYAEQCYFRMLDAGCKPQIARSLLPISVKTEIGMTANFREWRHVITLRTSKAAHPAIRLLINKVKDWFQENYPVIIEDLV